MKATLLALLLGSPLAGCTAAEIRAPTLLAQQQLTEHADRYIVAGVDDEASAPAGRAGSSPRGYDELSSYGPSAGARRLLRGVEADFRLREVQAWPIAPLHMHCAVLELPADADRAAVLTALSRDRRVAIAQPLQSFATQSATYDDPYVGLQRGFQQMDVADAHLASRGDGVRIAIIDTGVDILHPDLAGVIEETRNFVDADAERFRRDRHGTELAGIIAAVANNRQGIVGVAPGSRLHVYKACWQLRDTEDAARCNSFTLARALTAAIDARVQVVNLSLAGPADPLLRGLIEVGRRRGILFVVAASLGETSPEAFGPEGVIAVTNGGALGEPGSPLRAPGREILTLLPGGHYDFASGVSLATAQVTGTVALMLARNPHLTAVSAYQTLRSTSVRVVMEDPTAGVDDTINACAAVAAITGHGSCRENPSSHRVAMH